MHGSFMDRYVVPEGGELGEGGFGNVFTAVEKVTGIMRAVKRIPKDRLKDDPKMFENEVNSMMKLDHPNALKLIEWFDEEDHFMLVLELCTGPDLLSRIVNKGRSCSWCKGKLDEAETGRLVQDMLKAIQCCHSQGIIHHDIKPENFMFHTPDPMSSLKMIDLGLSELYKESEEKTESKASSERLTGTLAYMAPEIIQGKPYDPQCDMWSLGVIMWPMVTGKLLFPIDGDVKYKVFEDLIANPAYVEHQLRRAEGTMSEDAHDLLSRMLKHDPKERISAKDALMHPFLQRYRAGTNFSDGIPEQLPAQVAPSFDLDVVQKMEEFARQPQLKRAGRIALAHLIGTEDGESWLQRATFSKLDKLGLGSLTLAHFVTGCEEHGVKVTEGFGERVFPSVDTNPSENLNFNEFMAATIEVEAGKHDNVIKGAFQMLDQHGSGVLDVGGFQELFPQNSAQILEAMVRESAPSGQITYEEFYHLMTSSDAAKRMKVLEGFA